MTAARPSRARRVTRSTEGAQAAFEMALALPIMLIITLGFVGLMLSVRAASEFRTAVDLAAQASITPPLGDTAAACADAEYAFDHTLHLAGGGEAAFLDVTTGSVASSACPAIPGSPLNCDGPYARGAIAYSQPGVAMPMTCNASATIDFSRTPIAIFWVWSISMSATAEAYPSVYQGCSAPNTQACQPQSASP
jgi:Flp pilus assembly protein TadG